MSKNLQNCLNKLKFIAEIKDKKTQRKLLDENTDECMFKALKEIAINLLASKIKRKGLSKHSKLMRQFTKKKLTKKNKRKLIVQSGGWLQFAIPIVGALISQLIK